MLDDKLDCDLQRILERQESTEIELLQKLSALCQSIYSTTAASIETILENEKGYEHKQASMNEQLTQLHRFYKEKTAEREKIVLEHKVTDRKIAISKKQQEKLKEEIHDAKLQKESIALEMVDLAQENETARKKKIDRWNAIKKACFYYKENLDIHILCEQMNDCDQIKFKFFRNQDNNCPDQDNYYVLLENSNNSWKVGQIEPPLKDIHLESIRARVDVTKALRTTEISAFLCLLRRIFLKHYITK